MKETEMNEWTAATIGTVGEFIGVIESWEKKVPAHGVDHRSEELTLAYGIG
jgi:hypothetical protein